MTRNLGRKKKRKKKQSHFTVECQKGTYTNKGTDANHKIDVHILEHNTKIKQLIIQPLGLGYVITVPFGDRHYFLHHCLCQRVGYMRKCWRRRQTVNVFGP